MLRFPWLLTLEGVRALGGQALLIAVIRVKLKGERGKGQMTEEGEGISQSLAVMILSSSIGGMSGTMDSSNSRASRRDGAFFDPVPQSLRCLFVGYFFCQSVKDILVSRTSGNVQPPPLFSFEALPGVAGCMMFSLFILPSIAAGILQLSSLESPINQSILPENAFC